MVLITFQNNDSIRSETGHFWGIRDIDRRLLKREGPSSPLRRDLSISPIIIHKKKRRAAHREEEERAIQKKKKEGAGTTDYTGVIFRSLYLVQGREGFQGDLMAASIYTRMALAPFSMEA